MIAAAVIASGFSRRMGRSKLTLELGGRSFLERAVRAACTAPSVRRCLVVVRPEDTRLVAELPVAGVEVVENPEAASGQSASIRLAAVRLAADPTCEAVIFSVVDQPFLGPEVFERLAAAWRDGTGSILVSTYDGQRGNPVLFARQYLAELQELAGDVGGRVLLQRYPDAVRPVAMPDGAAGQDIDTWDAYEAARAMIDQPSESRGQPPDAGWPDGPPPCVPG